MSLSRHPKAVSVLVYDHDEAALSITLLLIGRGGVTMMGTGRWTTHDATRGPSLMPTTRNAIDAVREVIAARGPYRLEPDRVLVLDVLGRQHLAAEIRGILNCPVEVVGQADLDRAAGGEGVAHTV